jgi:hypothetical protein
MPAFSVRQPFASAIAAGVKRVENRDWHLPGFGSKPPGEVRRWYALHAGAELYRFSDPEGEDLRRAGARLRAREAGETFIRERWAACPAWSELPYGAVLGLVEVIGSEPSESPFVEDDEWTIPGTPCVWVFGEILCLPSPLAYKGAQGVFTVDAVTASRLRRLYEDAHPKTGEGSCAST